MRNINRKRILVIPHSSMTSVRVRAQELAKELSRQHEVFYLTWGQRHGSSVSARIAYALSELFRGFGNWQKNGVTFVQLPVLHRPFSLIKPFNRASLKRLLSRYSFDIVYSSSSYLFPFPANIPIHYIFDLADDHAAGCRLPNPRQARFVEEFVQAETSKATLLTTVSKELQQMLREKFNKDAVLIPNGTHVKEYSSVETSQTLELKKKLNISNRFVIGAIGNHGRWSGLEFLIQVFNAFNKEVPESCLLIVGPGSEVERLAPPLESDPNIIFTGPREPEQMPVYYSAIDIGVLPFDVNEFTNSALPMKIIEYSAAKKIVVSTPLDEIRSLGFPNILFAEQKLDPWVKALKKSMLISWEDEWNKAVVGYDWGQIATKLENDVFRKVAQE